VTKLVCRQCAATVRSNALRCRTCGVLLPALTFSAFLSAAVFTGFGLIVALLLIIGLW